MLAKRLFDIIVSLMGLLIFSPFFFLSALMIKLDSPGPVLFSQIRVGQHGMLFRIQKFRTMVIGAETLGLQISTKTDSRITRVGTFLRRYKLDELPQLLNVVCGHMSLVGPRPEVPRYVDMFSRDYDLLLMLRPGITDFAALEYRHENELLDGVENPEEVYVREILPVKIQYYHRYLRERSFALDMKIIINTIWSAFLE